MLIRAVIKCEQCPASAAKLLCLISAVVLICLATGVASSGPYVHYEISKTEFLLAEPVFITGWFENREGESIRYELDSLWRFRIIDADANEYPFMGREITKHYIALSDSSGTAIDRRSILLPNSTSPRARKCVTDEYGKGKGGFDLYLPVGDYMLSNSLYPSDTIRFSVSEPTNPIEQQASKELIEVIDDIYHRIGSYSQRYEYYKGFYQKYSNSIYVERALRNLICLSPENTSGYDEATRQRYVREFVIRFPQSGFNFEIVDFLKIEYVPVTERRSFAKALLTFSNGLWNTKRRATAEALARELED